LNRISTHKNENNSDKKDDINLDERVK